MGLYLNGKLCGMSLPQNGSIANVILARNITENVISSGDKVWIEPTNLSYEIKDFYGTTPNFIVEGNPTITNKIISGFSSSNYIKFGLPFNPGNNSWEAVLKFTTGSDINTSQGLFTSLGSNGASPFFISSGNLKAYFYNGGTIFLDLFSLDINTEYTIKAVFDGSSYKWYSLENSEWVLKYTLNSSASVFGGRVPVLGNDKGSESPFLGSMDLSECYIKVNGLDWWTAYLSNILQSTLCGIAQENIGINEIGSVKTVLPN